MNSSSSKEVRFFGCPVVTAPVAPGWDEPRYPTPCDSWVERESERD